MIRLLVVLCSAVILCDGVVEVYRPFVSLNREYSLGKTRRTSVPSAEPLAECPFICSLHDIVWTKKCTGSVVAPNWVLTAAHCIDDSLRYVTYNTNKPFTGGTSVDIEQTYHHNGYVLHQSDEGSGKGVYDLHHDVGLVRTARPMVIKTPMIDPLMSTLNFTPAFLNSKIVKVYGFRRLKKNEKTEDLIAATLVLKECNIASSWYYCVCGVARADAPASDICALDSGGPVLYNGTMVGIVLMGPLECATRTEPAPGTASVFLSLYKYMDVIEATIHQLKDVPTLGSRDTALQDIRTDAVGASLRLDVACAYAMLLFLIVEFFV